MEKKLTIIYRDGTEESLYVDDFYVSKDGCLVTYKRFGENSGTRHIPLANIKEWRY